MAFISDTSSRIPLKHLHLKKRKENPSLFSRGGRAGGLFGLWVRRSGSMTGLGKG